MKNSEICIDGPSTKNINGENVYRSCWNYESDYTCTASSPTPEAYCQTLIDRGCSPLSQTCDADGCVQTYECTNGTTSSTPVASGCDTQTMKVGNLTYDTGYQANTNVGRVLSTTAAVNDAATNMIKNDQSCYENPPGSGNYQCIDPISIFSGTSKSCKQDMLAFNECCKLDGWGVGAGLAQCTQDEQILGYARADGRTHYIGKYCSSSTIFGCLEKKEVYCVFTSKIGRIIQEQGRPQLGIGWGSPHTPNCTGFSDAQLANINFDLIDFSGYFADALANTTNPPNSTQMKSIIDTYVNKLKSANCSQFQNGCIAGVKSGP